MDKAPRWRGVHRRGPVELLPGPDRQLQDPRYWKFTDSFPMTVTGKVRKVEMREVSVQELGLQQAALVKTA